MLPDNETTNSDAGPYPVILGLRNAQSLLTVTVFQCILIASWAATAVIALIFYARLLYILRRIARNGQANQTQQSTRSQSQEFRLLAYSIILFVLHGSTTIFEVLILYSTTTWYKPVQALIDFNSYSNPYFLLALSTPLRDRFLTFVKLRKLPNGGSFGASMQAQSVHRNQGANVNFALHR